MKSFVIKTSAFIIFIGIMLAVTLHFGGNAILKHAIIAYFHHKTGFQVALADAWLDLKNDTIVVEGFVVLNPRGFSERIFADFDRLLIHWDYRRFMNSSPPRDIIFPEIEYIANRFVVEKRADGITNLSLLKGLKPIKTKPLKDPTKKRVFLIERFVVSLRQVGYVDHTKTIGKYKVFNVNVDKKVFENIDEPGLLGKILIMEALKSTTIDKVSLGIDTKLLDMDLASLTSNGVEFGSDKLAKGLDVTEDVFSSMADYSSRPFRGVASSSAYAIRSFFESIHNRFGRSPKSKEGVVSNATP